jgi:threonine dehydrogenase-like Zn-dependent dehydrogenase
LADPFSVSFHAIRHVPPTGDGTALVYGCGTLGLLAIAILRMLHPDVRVLAVARFDHQARLAEKLGAQRVLQHQPTRAIIDAAAEATGADTIEPWRGLPVLNGGIDVVYDTVSSPETFEVGLRCVRSRGSIVALGVEPPRRFEWTPLYFKEISIIGSNGFGIEEYDGRRQHAMEWYFEFIRTHRIDYTSIISHRFSLAAYREAFMVCYAQGDHAAVKVLFDNFDDSE